MATTLAAKPASAVYRYTWLVPVVEGDGVASVTLTASGATVASYEIDGSEVTFFVSGGTNGATASIAASAVTDDGETLIDTFYIPIRDTALAFTYTARDLCSYALRKIFGNAEEADADALADALERLNGMLAEWRIDGMDVGVPLPVVEATVFKVRDEFIRPIRANLLVEVASHYGRDLTALEIREAERGKILLGNTLISLTDLSFDRTLRGVSAFQ